MSLDIEPGTLSEDEFQTLIRHLDAFPAAETCPVCSFTEWDVPAMKEHPVYVEAREKRMTGTLLVSLVCSTCAYVRQFAWRGVCRE